MIECKKLRNIVTLAALAGLLVMSGLSGAVYAAEDNLMVLNNITLDKNKKEIRLKTTLAITEGILEYLLVGDHGKTYESVLKVAQNLPSELNFALLLIGSEPLRYDIFMSLLQEEKGMETLKTDHKASLIELEIRQNNRLVDIDKLIKTRENRPMEMTWVYTGGYFLQNNRFAGDLIFNYIGIWPDRTAIINLFSNLSNPYQGDFGFEINKDNKDLKVDQEFEIIIRRYSP